MTVLAGAELLVKRDLPVPHRCPRGGMPAWAPTPAASSPVL